MSRIYLVTGASRGIGVEFVRQLAEKGHTVIACARAPEKSEKLQAIVDGKRVHAVTMDTVDADSVKAAVEKISQIAPAGIDVLINNAGVGGQQSNNPETTSRADYMRVFETNVVGTSNVTQAFLRLLRKRSTRQIINISSILGSLVNTDSAFYNEYRVSKAAENMLTRLWAAHLRSEGFIVVSVHPGHVQTDMGGKSAPVTPEESISGMLFAFDKLTKESNGTFFDYKNQTVAW